MSTTLEAELIALRKVAHEARLVVLAVPPHHGTTEGANALRSLASALRLVPITIAPAPKALTNPDVEPEVAAAIADMKNEGG